MKRNKKKHLEGSAKTLQTARTWEMATPERKNQLGGVVKELEPANANSRAMITRHRARYECTLDAYLLRGKIDQDEFKAGTQFRRAYLMKVDGIPHACFVERVDGGRFDFDPMKDKTWAEKRLSEAYAELPLIQTFMVDKVCGKDQLAGGDKQIKTLHRGLDRLARLWGFA